MSDVVPVVSVGADGAPARTREIEIVATGPATTIQDLGRPGLAHLGVGPSGACDPDALRLANRLVGNDEGAAGFEATLGGLVLRARTDTWIAATGAPVKILLDGRPQAMGCAIPVAAWTTVRLATPGSGLRTYVAVRGGLAVPAVLSSRSTDVLTGLGPLPPASGDVLPLGPVPAGPVPGVDVPGREPPAAPGPASPDGVLRAACLPGPRTDWLTDAGRALLHSATFTVSPDSNRIGARLSGPRVERARADELPSEGIVVGAVQIPPSGQPVVFLADHPTTGGYPVAAVVTGAGLRVVAQARPGDRIRLVL